MTIGRFTAIDCFAGAGGLSLGLETAGFDVRAAFDLNEHAVATYDKNLGPHILCSDIKNMTGNGLLEFAGLSSGECDLLAGGPPCQGFSVQRRGSDVDVRNGLILEFFRVVDEVRPKAFLVENVAAIGGKRGIGVLNEFLTLASELGYQLTHEVLDACEYGVPQRRRRMFIVGVQAGGSVFEFPSPTHTRDSALTVRSAIADLPDPFLNLEASKRFPNHDPDNISPLNRERISYVPEGGGRADIPEALRLKCHAVSVDRAGHRGVYGRLWWDRPSGTITTKCNSFTRGRFAHPEANRNITMREAARLQGFPDTFVFHGSRVEVAHQIGNAVPPPLASVLGQALIAMLDRRADS